MIRLLILTCGTNACYHISKVLKEKYSDDFYIVGTDINKKWLIPTCNYLDSFYQSPLSSDSSYYDYIIDICRNEQIDYILPSFDYDQFLFFPENEDLMKLNVKSLGISKDCFSFYSDKIATNKYLQKIGIPVPELFDKDSVLIDEKYFVKPKNGVGSIGVRILSGNEIRELKNINDYVIQEICSEPEFTQECFVYNSQLYSITRERIASKSGVCTKTRIFKDEKLDAYAKILIDNVKTPYMFNLQFMMNSKNDYVCTDLNLRTAGGMSLSYAAGWDEVSSLANVMLKSSENEIVKTINQNIGEKYIVRAYTDIVTKEINKKIAFDLDGTLLDSRERHSIVMDIVLRENNIHLDTKDLVKFKSEKRNNLDWLYANNIEKNIAEKINSEWITKIENEEYLLNDKLYPNVVEILKKLSKDNLLYIITARKSSENVIQQIKNLGIHSYFEDIIVVTGKNVELQKANALRQKGIQIMIGDTEVDYEAAMLANCKFYASKEGFRSESFWKNKNIEFVNYESI